MKVNLQTIKSGKAGGKQIVVVEGYGSFHPIYEQLYALGMMHLYVCHSNKEADVKLCRCLLEVAEFIGVDCDELVDSLPKGWDEEFKFYPTIFKYVKEKDDWRGAQGYCDFEPGPRTEMI